MPVMHLSVGGLKGKTQFNLSDSGALINHLTGSLRVEHSRPLLLVKFAHVIMSCI